MQRLEPKSAQPELEPELRFQPETCDDEQEGARSQRSRYSPKRAGSGMVSGRSTESSTVREKAEAGGGIKPRLNPSVEPEGSQAVSGLC